MVLRRKKKALIKSLETVKNEISKKSFQITTAVKEKSKPVAKTLSKFRKKTKRFWKDLINGTN